MSTSMQLTTKDGQAARPSKPVVFRCDGDDALCDLTQQHWICVSASGTVTSWPTWQRAMLRATKEI